MGEQVDRLDKPAGRFDGCFTMVVASFANCFGANLSLFHRCQDIHESGLPVVLFLLRFFASGLVFSSLCLIVYFLSPWSPSFSPIMSTIMTPLFGIPCMVRRLPSQHVILHGYSA